MNRGLIFLGLVLLLSGCSIHYVNPATDYVSHIDNCSATIRVEDGTIVDGVSVVGENTTFNTTYQGGIFYGQEVMQDWTLRFTGWVNDTCYPVLEYTDNRRPNSAGRYTLPPPPSITQSALCNYTKEGIQSQGENGTLALLLSRCGIPRSQSVLVFGWPFPQYQSG